MARFKIKKKPTYVILKPEIKFYEFDLDLQNYNIKQIIDIIKKDIGFELDTSNLFIHNIQKSDYCNDITFAYEIIPNEELEKLNYEKYLKDLAEYEKWFDDNLENINKELNRREQVKKEKILEAIKQKEKELKSLRNKMNTNI